MAKPYFEFLISKGYITRDNTEGDGATLYELTDKGKHLLQTLEHVQAQLEGFFPSDREPQGVRREHKVTK